MRGKIHDDLGGGTLAEDLESHLPVWDFYSGSQRTTALSDKQQKRTTSVRQQSVCWSLEASFFVPHGLVGNMHRPCLVGAIKPRSNVRAAIYGNVVITYLRVLAYDLLS